MTIIVTGCAGFIGFHLSLKLLESHNIVIGIDSLNSYYDVNLKKSRLDQLVTHKNFNFFHIDIANLDQLNQVIQQYNDISHVFHLAAQAGVRYSIEKPFAYSHNNIDGTLALLEACKHLKSLKQFIFASSSSVYGNDSKIPFEVTAPLASPMSIYAATKIAKEALCYSYSNIYNLPITALRFFTVYGPWGRPDMAIYQFSQALVNNQVINLYNNGEMSRDFTYIDDVVAGIIGCINSQQIFDDLKIPYRVYNLGNSKTVSLKYFVKLLEQNFKRKANIINLAVQPGDMLKTFADISLSKQQLNYHPKISIEQGITLFVDWFKKYHHIAN